MADYDRDTGFTRGPITVTNHPFTLTMDRGRSFSIDELDAEETGIGNLIGSVTSEFVRTQVVPELDAYCLSKLGGAAVEAGQTVEMGDDAVKTLQEAMLNVQEANGFGDDQLVAFVDRSFYAALMASPGISRQLVLSDFKKGDINTQVKSLDNCAIIPVSSARMKTAYEFLDGVSEGKEYGGFKPAENAKSIRMLVMPKNGTASLVKKLERTRTFSPEQNLTARSYLVDFRCYYDAFVRKSKLGTIYVCVE